MIQGLKLVVVTPAGRRRYLEVIAPRVLADPDVDRWDLWLNTMDNEDTRYMYALRDANPGKVRVVESPAPPENPIAYRIHNFYPFAADPGELYVRIDDDTCYYSPGSIGRVASRRLEDPHPFFVYGNVVNTALTTYWHHKLGRLDRGWDGCTYDCMCPLGWKSGELALALHEKFLADPTPGKWHLPDFVLKDYERHSITCTSWTGEDSRRWCRDVGRDEEDWLTCVKPKADGRPSLVTGDNLFVHFSFYTQRPYLSGGHEDRLLDQYRRLP